MKKKFGQKKMYTWVLYGLGAALCFGIMVLIFKKLFLMGISPLHLNLIIFGLVFIGFGVWIGTSKEPWSVTWPMLIFLIIAAAASMCGNYFDMKAISLAPNPGYAATLKASQIMIIALAAPLLYKSELTIIKISGILLVLLGVVLLAI